MSKAAVMALDLFQKIVEESYKIEKPRLREELENRAKSFRVLANKLKHLCRDSKTSLLFETSSKIQEVATQIELIAESIKMPFLIFTVGMGKYGKSTLVNALVGSRVAEMDVLPKTWKIDIFTSTRPEGKALLKYKTGREEEMTIEEVKNFLAKEEQKYEESMHQVREELKKYLPRLKTIEEREEFKLLLKKKLLYNSPVIEVHWPIPKSRILKQFNIVDTPGLFQDFFSNDIKANIKDYYNKADGVLWMLDATKISAKKSYELIKSLEDAIKEIGGKTENIIAVLNRIDLVNPSERELVLEEAYRIFGNVFCDIVAFSAKQALLSIESGDTEGLRQSGYFVLLESIEKNFLSKALHLQKKSKLLGFKGFTSEVVRITDEYQKRLENDEKRRANLEKSLDGEITEFIKDIEEKIKSRIAIYKKQATARINSINASIYKKETDQEVNEYIKKVVINEEELAKLEEDLAEILNVNMKNFIASQYKKSSFREFRYLQDEFFMEFVEIVDCMSYQPEFSISSDLNAFSVAVGIGSGFLLAALLGSPILGIMGGLLFHFTGLGREILKSFHLNSIKANLQNTISQTLQEYMKKYEESLSKFSDDLKEKITAVRENSFASLHCPSNLIQHVLKTLDEIRNPCTKPIKTIDVSKLIKGGYSSYDS